jgi:hypothetical protein
LKNVRLSLDSVESLSLSTIDVVDAAADADARPIATAAV